MADKKNFNEVEDNEEIFVEEEEREAETPEAEEEPEIIVEDKKPNGFIKGCKKAGRIVEAGLAIFGGVVGGLMIYDGVKVRRQRKNYIPAQPQQIPSSTTQEVLNDAKVDITEF
jgi:hypothetical protein